MSDTPTPVPSPATLITQVIEFLGGELAKSPTVLKLAGLGAVVAAAIPGDITSGAVRAALIAVGGFLTAVVHYAESKKA
jgi:hypothetical protein